MVYSNALKGKKQALLSLLPTQLQSKIKCLPVQRQQRRLLPSLCSMVRHTTSSGTTWV